MLSHTIPESVANLERLGVSRADAFTLRRIAMTLHRWHELECGTDAGHVERDPSTNKPYFCSARIRAVDYGRTLIADREAGALRRLARVMASYPHLSAYVQGDPRGASLYILRPGDVPEGEKAESYYSRGIAIYK